MGTKLFALVYAGPLTLAALVLGQVFDFFATYGRFILIGIAVIIALIVTSVIGYHANWRYWNIGYITYRTSFRDR